MAYVRKKDVARSQLLQALGKNLRAARTRKGLSQQQVADLAGSDDSYVSSVETGNKNLTMDSLGRLADAVGCDPLRLMGAALPTFDLGVLERMLAAAHKSAAQLLKEHGRIPVTAELVVPLLHAVGDVASDMGAKPPKLPRQQRQAL